MNHDQDLAKLRALCNRLMQGDGDLTPAELTESLELIAGPRSATKVLGAAQKRFFGTSPARRRVRRGIGSY